MKNKLGFVFAVLFVLAGFFINISPAGAQSVTTIQNQEQQLAALSAYLGSLKNLLSLLQNLLTPPVPAHAQTALQAPVITQPANGGTVSPPLKISWSGAVSPNYYSVYRSLNSTSSWSILSGCVDLPYTTTQCTDSTASGSANYNVGVCTGPQGNMGACTGSNTVTVTVGGAGSSSPSPAPLPAIPNAPTLNTPYASGLSVNLSWSFQSSTSWYNVSRRTPPGSVNPWTAVANAISTTAYTDSNVTAGTNYEYHVNACNSSGCSGDSNYMSVSLSSSNGSSTPPSPPLLNGIAATASPISFSWSSVSGADYYALYRRSPAGSGTWPTTATFSNLAGISFSDSAVTSSTSYEYYVVSCKNGGACSAPSNYQSVTAGSGAADTQPPSTPTGLVATKDISGEVDLSWTASTDNVGVAGYKVWRSYNAIWTQIGASANTSYVDTTVSPATPYYYYVVAYDAAGNLSPQSSQLFLNTPSVIVASTTNILTAPSAPSNLTASVSGSNVTLNWTDNSLNESGFKLYRGPTWTDIGNVGANTTSYTDSNLAAGTYAYHLNAFVSASGSYPVYSGVSNDVSVTVGGNATTTPLLSTPISVPAAPSGLTYSLLNGGAVVNLSWTDNSTDETRFEIYRQPQGGTWIYYAQVGTNITSYSDTNAAAGGYSYQVAACNGASANIGCSYGSNTVFATTSGTAASSTITAAQTVPNAPSNLMATVGSDPATGANKIYLSWTDNSNNELGFKLYRSLNGGVWADIGNVGPGITSYADANLSPGTYAYHLNAFALSNGAYVYSAPTNDATLTLYAPTISSSTTITPIAAPTYVNQPYGLTTHVPPGSTSVSLAWTNNSSAATSINIGRRPSGGPVWTTIGTVGGSAASYTDANVPPGNYDYEVFACNPAGCPQNGSNWMPAAVGSALYVDLRVDGMKGTVYRSAPASYTLTWNTSGAYGSGCAPSGNWGESASKSIPSGSEYFTGVTVSPADANPKVYTLTCFNAKGESVSDTVKVQITSAGVFATSTTSITGAFLKGMVADASGVSVPGVYVHVFTDGFSLNFSAFTDASGAFGINLPAGTYWIGVSPPSSHNDLIKPAPMQVNVSEGSVKTVTLQFNAGAKTIAGTASFSTGQPVTDAEVGAYSSDTHQWVSMFADQNGKYSLCVSGGAWQVGIRPRSPMNAGWSWTGAFPTVSFKNDGTAEAQTVNFTVPVSDVQLTVHTVDEVGNSLRAGVVVDVVSAAQKPPEGANVAPPIFQKSDASGSASFTLKAGKYYLRAFLPPEFGYYNPDEQTLQFVSGQSQDAKLVFRKRSTASTAAIRGTTKLEDGTLTDAFIWAWSENGESMQLRSGENGGFGFPAVAGRWHIGAGKEVNGYPYKSSELTVDIEDGDAADVEIILSSLGKDHLAPPVTVSQPSTQQIIAQSQDGAKVSVPDGTAASTGNVSLEVRPTIEAPSQGGAKVVSTVYDINLKDSSGTAIISLQKKIEIDIPYDPDELNNQGISPDRIVPSYYDDSTGTWVKADDYTIDKEKHVAVVRIQHLTRFAIIAAADITPPDAPTDISAIKGASGVLISWRNPTTDFDHVKVYRSVVKGNLGKLILNNITDAQASDADVEAGIRYYYTVRAVDPAGNESTNLEQVSLVASGGKSGKFSRKLTQGARGEDVKTLQVLLIKDGDYPEGVVSGYFGKLTKAAVIRFQEKYADEILGPVGLERGNGVVGNGTRAKLNQLFK